MEKDFVQLLKKKAAEQAKSPVDPKKLEAKKNVINDLMGMLKGGMASELKKVTVASDSKEGLSKGLNKAQQIIGSASEDAEEGQEEENEVEESEEMQASEDSKDADQDAKIAELERQLAELKSKKLV